ncbi:molybdopterin-binding protein [Methylomonas sp. DH-1]|uniref:competence/damage-inducible protein A n=1 Tax=Methylomonas sp. (strain DH-1) TaxID=1727196 RepID=UPI0007C95925|nr:competence/damage-inducible protein A [Methylomonas sp. DH-1]ANE55621.1 competence/damage-inducible protein A [Methylomonas sp. DH-1]
MTLIAEIFSQGAEIVSGQTVDTNAAWLSQQLAELGFTLKRHTAVGDDLQDLAELFGEIAGRADCCICTGGLGPTCDDLTAEAVSVASGLPLEFDAAAFAAIQAYYARRQRTMPEANRKQALLPAGAVRIDNRFGTAPGFALRFRRCWFVFLPGVPFEMKQMFGDWVRTDLLQRFALRPDTLVTLRCIGLGESAIQQKLESLALPPGVVLGFRAAADEVQAKLLFPADVPEAERRRIAAEAAARIGDCVFAVDGLPDIKGDLVAVVDAALAAGAHSLAILETASHGLLAAKCLGRQWLKHAALRLHNETAGTDQQCASHAATLARELQAERQTDFALVQLYRVGSGRFDDKDGGIVLYNALATPQGVVSRQSTAHGAGIHKQNQAALLALDLLRRYFQHSCL